jgi:hypothetical protein
LRDPEDMDIDNDGIDNLEDVDVDEIVSKLHDIIDSHKFAVGGYTTFRDRFVKLFGGFTSYRLISQAYFEAGSPVEPVLKDLYIKSLNEKRYDVSFDYIIELRTYYLLKDELLDLIGE